MEDKNIKQSRKYLSIHNKLDEICLSKDESENLFKNEKCKSLYEACFEFFHPTKPPIFTEKVNKQLILNMSHEVLNDFRTRKQRCLYPGFWSYLTNDKRCQKHEEILSDMKISLNSDHPMRTY